MDPLSSPFRRQAFGWDDVAISGSAQWSPQRGSDAAFQTVVVLASSLPYPAAASIAAQVTLALGASVGRRMLQPRDDSSEGDAPRLTRYPLVFLQAGPGRLTRVATESRRYTWVSSLAFRTGEEDIDGSNPGFGPPALAAVAMFGPTPVLDELTEQLQPWRGWS